MSLKSIFFCIFVLLLLILWLPLQVQFEIEHQKQWRVIWNVKIFFWQMPFSHSDMGWVQHAESKMQSLLTKQSDIKCVTQMMWKSIFPFMREIFCIVGKRLRLEHFDIRCVIGWDRADYTAYSYGLFWAMMAMLPDAWLKKGEIFYTPDFQCNRQEIAIQGIIHCTIGKVIGIVFACFQLTVRWMLEQNRKEQVVYEN